MLHYMIHYSASFYKQIAGKNSSRYNNSLSIENIYIYIYILPTNPYNIKYKE